VAIDLTAPTTEPPVAAAAKEPPVAQSVRRQAAALFLIAPTIAVSIAPPAPPATTCEIMPPMLKSPDCAAAVTAGSARVTIWPSTPPPTGALFARHAKIRTQADGVCCGAGFGPRA